MAIERLRMPPDVNDLRDVIEWNDDLHRILTVETAYGELWHNTSEHGGNIVITMAAANTWYAITGFGADGESGRFVRPESTSNEGVITLDRANGVMRVDANGAGVYLFNAQLSISLTASGVNIYIAASVNGTPSTKVFAGQYFPTTTRPTTISLTGILELDNESNVDATNGDTVGVMIMTDNASVPWDSKIHYANVNIHSLRWI